MKYLITVFFIFLIGFELSGQTTTENITGKVSFVSTQNIYVKFTSTSGISAGDTLFKISDGKKIPALKVINLSSTSCVCSAISSTSFSIADQLVARKKAGNIKIKEKAAEKVTVLNKDSVGYGNSKAASKLSKQKISGSLSASSYTDFSNTSASGSNRFRYNFSLDARNIANSKFSVESYISFNHKSGEWSAVKNNLFNALKIYDLAVKYDISKNVQISLGRKINQKISNIGAMDGLQVETSLNKFAIGALVGTRPDFENYGFNRKLLQYGGYLAFSSVSAAGYFESSLAFMQQMNNGKTDRRFLYFQLSNSLIKNIYFFSTFEIDLYKLNNNLSQNTFDLSGLYLSMRYKMTKNFSITGSYDGRKNIMYYETFKTFIDRILETEMRQSFRLQADYRITKSLTFGLQSGYRFLKADPNPSKNLYGYLTYYQIPGINASVTISGTYLESNYLNSKIIGMNVSKDFFKGKFYTDLGYRYMDYKYTEGLLNTVQHIGEMGIYMQLFKKLSLSVNYEGTFEKQNKYNRVYLQIRRRF
jgi:hypothetical protein